MGNSAHSERDQAHATVEESRVRGGDCLDASGRVREGTVAGERAHFTQRTFTTREFFGCTNRLVLYADFRHAETLARARECWARLKWLMGEVDHAVSTVRADSDVSRVNAAAPGEVVELGEVAASIVGRAKELGEFTGGLFSPATCHLTDLWGFSPRVFNPGFKASKPFDRAWEGDWLPAPDPAYVEAFRRLADFRGVEVGRSDKATWLVKVGEPEEVEGVTYSPYLDFGGIAKGWVADSAAGLARAFGFDYGSFSCGSSIALLGNGTFESYTRRTRDYSIGLAKPRPDVVAAGTSETESSCDPSGPSSPCDPEHYIKVSCHDCAISTSGDYGRSYMREGVLYSHIIDVRSGLPLNVSRENLGGSHHEAGLCTVTLLGPSATDGDALATALCLMGPDGAMDFYERHLRGEGWDIIAVAYDNSHPGRFDVLTSLPKERYRILVQRYSVREARVR